MAALVVGSIVALFSTGHFVVSMLLLHLLTPLVVIAGVSLLTTTFEARWAVAMAAMFAVLHRASGESVIAAMVFMSWQLLAVIAVVTTLSLATWWFVSRESHPEIRDWPSATGAFAMFGASASALMWDVIEANETSLDVFNRQLTTATVAAAVAQLLIIALVLLAVAKVRHVPVWLGVVSFVVAVTLMCGALTKSTLLMRSESDWLLTTLALSAFWSSAAALGPKVAGWLVTSAYFVMFLLVPMLNALPSEVGLIFCAVCSAIGALALAGQLVWLRRRQFAETV